MTGSCNATDCVSFGCSARRDVVPRAAWGRWLVLGLVFAASGFLSLMAADANDEIDTVIATAPAAFDDYANFHGSWRANAMELCILAFLRAGPFDRETQCNDVLWASEPRSVAGPPPLSIQASAR